MPAEGKGLLTWMRRNETRCLIPKQRPKAVSGELGTEAPRLLLDPRGSEFLRDSTIVAGVLHLVNQRLSDGASLTFGAIQWPTAVGRR